MADEFSIINKNNHPHEETSQIGDMEMNKISNATTETVQTMAKQKCRFTANQLVKVSEFIDPKQKK